MKINNKLIMLIKNKLIMLVVIFIFSYIQVAENSQEFIENHSLNAVALDHKSSVFILNEIKNSKSRIVVAYKKENKEKIIYCIKQFYKL